MSTSLQHSDSIINSNGNLKNIIESWDDLPEEWEHLIHDKMPQRVAIDTETTGLKMGRDRLCLVQVCAQARGTCFLIRIRRDIRPAPRLIKLISDPHITKLFHFALFDIHALHVAFQVMCTPSVCTKIASKIVRTYTEHHSLKEVCRELLGVDLNKAQRSTYWGQDTLSEAQKIYAAKDVLFLHEIHDLLLDMARQENRELALTTAWNMLSQWVELERKGFDIPALFSPMSHAV
jgi:ribonuclease D